MIEGQALDSRATIPQWGVLNDLWGTERWNTQWFARAANSAG